MQASAKDSHSGLLSGIAGTIYWQSDAFGCDADCGPHSPGSIHSDRKQMAKCYPASGKQPKIQIIEAEKFILVHIGKSIDRSRGKDNQLFDGHHR